VVARFPHDTAAFTQGLLFDNRGRMWESTGRNGESTLRQVDLQTGKARVVYRLPDDQFGEGLAIADKRFFWLTWQSGICHTLSLAGKPGAQLRYEGEGWGLCSEPGGKLWMSNGSSTLTLRSPRDFSVQKSLKVHSGGAEVPNLNELEWIDGKIYANVWGTPLVAIIAPQDGEVQAFVDFSGLLSPAEAAQADVLNGIAYHEAEKRLYITGKLWPRLYEVRIRPL
jgi:glutaminyl-peptide cyclotransferase